MRINVALTTLDPKHFDFSLWGFMNHIPALQEAQPRHYVLADDGNGFSVVERLIFRSIFPTRSRLPHVDHEAYRDHLLERANPIFDHTQPVHRDIPDWRQDHNRLAELIRGDEAEEERETEKLYDRSVPAWTHSPPIGELTMN